MAETAKKTTAKKTTAKKTTAKKTASSSSSSSSVSKGDLVLVQVDPMQNNGDSEAVGFVVGVDDRGTPTMVNVKVLLDGSDTLLLRNVAFLTKAEAKKKDAPTKRAVRA